MGLHHVVAIDEGLLSGRLHPDLVLREFSQVVEAGDVKAELAGLRELPEAHSCGYQLFLSNACNELQQRSSYVIYALLVESEDVVLILAVD